MTHVITQSCCNDAACVPVCPVNCIHPTPDEPGYGTAEMLYIDPAGCIDCGACLDACPVSAIAPDYDLSNQFLRYEDLNAEYFRSPAHQGYDPTPARPTVRDWDSDETEPLRVAIVGSGPAACYAAEELLSQRGLQVTVDMFERLTTPWGLVRFGVAPDHQDTKQASDAFARTVRRKDFRLFLDVEVGDSPTHEDLTSHYHAVIYAVGAMGDRTLDIPGEHMPGSHSATEFVAWYNGHPDFADRTFDLSGERAVIIGNGNVALDVARILLTDIEALRRTDIADHALEALAKSNVREVVVIGRRGPAQAAFTTPELFGLDSVAGIDVCVLPAESTLDEASRGALDDDQHGIALNKARLIADLPAHSDAARSIVLRFALSPTEILGDSTVTSVRLVRNKLVTKGGSAVIAVPSETTEEISCGLVFRSVGYRGHAIAGLPFDDAKGTLPHVGGRVVDPASLQAIDGVYATGWIKRGPSGVIGTNKQCAKETVTSLLDDWASGNLSTATTNDIAELLPDKPGLAGWRAIDEKERALGRTAGRPRVKIVDHPTLLRVANDTTG